MGSDEVYVFGPFELDPAERTLRRAGEAVPLTPKAFDTLVVLVRRHGHLVDKDDLIKAVWPDTFVADGSLAFNIAQLRKALGSSEKQQYIETIPRYGYRFVGEVRKSVASEPPESPAKVAVSPGRRYPSPLVIGAAAIVALLGGAWAMSRAHGAGRDDNRVARAQRSANPEAERLYLEGRRLWNTRSRDGISAALDRFSEAAKLDSRYALAYAGMADAYAVSPSFGYASAHASMPRAREAALHALREDDTIAEAHAVLGFVSTVYDYDLVQGERELRRAIELDPSYATAHYWYGNLLSMKGSHEQALEEFHRALALDPSSLIIRRMYGEALIRARRSEAAITSLSNTAELNPGFPVQLPLAAAYRLTGRHTESVEAYAKHQEQAGAHEIAGQIRREFTERGWIGFLRFVTSNQGPTYMSSVTRATFLAELEEKEKAFDALERAYESRETAFATIISDPLLDPLRSDERFAALVRRITVD